MASKVRLTDFIKVKHGYAFEGEYFSEERTNDILVTPGNFKIGGGFKKDKFKFYNGPVDKEYILEAEDLIITMTDLSKEGDTLGYPALVPNDSNRYLHNQRVGKVLFKNNLVDKDYLYFLLCTKEYRNEILSSATGATVKHTAPDRIEKFEFILPSLNEQKKVAEKLRCIENKTELNLQIIENLEKLIQAIYTEWFVNFRFPEHEKIQRIDSGLSEFGSIPEGWRIGKLKDLIFLNYGKALKAEERVAGEYPVYGSSGVVGTHNAFLTEGPAIIVGRKGNVGSCFYSKENFYPIDTVYFIAKEQSNLFVYNLIKNMTFQNNDAAVPGLNRDIAHAMKIIIPPQEIITHFIDAISPLYSLKFNLEKQNKNLASARKILIPKLYTIDTNSCDGSELYSNNQRIEGESIKSKEGAHL